MLSRPRLRSAFDVVPLPPRQLFLMDEQRKVVLDGEVYLRLAPLLDGTRSVTDIASGLAEKAGLHDVLLALGQLEKRGCLADGPLDLPPLEAAWFDTLAGEPPLGEPLRAARISVRAVGNLSPEPMLQALRAGGLEVDDSGDVQVVLTDDYLRAELGDLNRAALAAKRPFLLVKPVGLVAWIGPIVVPGVTGCWRCLAQRLGSNLQMEKYIRDRNPQAGPLVRSRAALPATQELALELAVTELRRWLQVRDARSLEGRVLSFDLLNRAARDHVLVRRPHCADCGDSAGASAGPVALESRKKGFRADGGHRVVTPAETFERYKHHISPITGAVTDLRPALGRYDPELTPAFVAGHNFAMGLDSVVFLKDSLRGMSGGKGASTIQAKVSGLCEALERYSGIWSGEELVRRGTFAELAPKAIHPNACMGYSEAQFLSRGEVNPDRPPSRYVLVPRPFDPTLEIDWTPVWSLTKDEERLVPSAYCYYGHPEFKGRWCIPDSNGCAAGNTLEEATLQGFMEVVERDAVALWWYNRIRRQGVDLDSFGLPYVRAVREHYAAMGRSLWVLDLTSDLGIPTLGCVSARLNGPTQDVLVGFGAHFDPKVALLRAITEVNQFLPSVCYTRPDGTTLYLFGDELAKHWWTTARVEDLDYLRPHPDQPAMRLSDFVDPSTDDLAEDVRLCVDRARERGLEVMLLDQTRPDIGLRVVRVLVPGLCHFWRRLGFDRLYDVPVEQGWLATKHTPEQLNPYTIFF